MCVFPSAPTKRRIGFLVVFINSSDRRICFLFRSAQENGDGGTKGKDTRGGKKKKQMRKRNEKKIHTKKNRRRYGSSAVSSAAQKTESENKRKTKNKKKRKKEKRNTSKRVTAASRRPVGSFNYAHLVRHRPGVIMRPVLANRSLSSQ